MNAQTPVRIFSAVLLGFLSLGLTHQSQGQTNNWLPTSGTNAWTEATNWSSSTVPNASGAMVLFGAPQTVSLNQAVTVGSIFTTNTSGNVVIGDANDGSDILVMDAGTNSPVINVAPNGTLFMYADLEGANGYTKSGGGTLHLRYNPNDQFIDGPLVMAGGKLQVRYDGHFGGALNGYTNPIVFSGSSTIENFSTLPALEIANTRSVIINSGVTGGFQNALSAGLTINCPITGAGNLQLIATNGFYKLNATNTYSGNTTLHNGAKLILAPGANISTNNLLVSGANAGTSIDLGGNTQGIGNLSNTVSVVSTMVVTNGTLNLFGTNNQALGSQPDGSAIDLSGLAGFSFSNSIRNFTFQSGTGASMTTNTLNLSALSNTIAATQIQIGGATSAGTVNAAVVKMGQTNQFFANTIILGGFNASGYLNGLTNVTPTMVLRGTDGVTAVGTLKIGETSSGARAGWGDLNVGNGSIDALITNLAVGRHIAGANNPETSSLSFSNGSVLSENAILAEKFGTGTPTITGTVNQGGGIFEVGTLTMGVGSAVSALPVLKPTFNLSGGVLRAASIVAGAGASGTNYATSSERRINWTGGSIRPRNNGTNLTISGTSGAGGTIDILALGGGLKTLTTDGSNSVVLSGGTWLSANGGDLRIDPGEGGTFTTTGAFTVGSAPFANTPAAFSTPLNASITIVSGTNNITAATRIFGIGDRTNAGVTNSFNVIGGRVNVALTVNRMLVGNKSIGEVNVTGGLLEITGNQGIYVGGDPSFGGNGAQGTWTISGGTVNLGGTGVFVLGQNSATTSNVTSNSIGTLNLSGGNLITARAITTGVNTNGTTSMGIVRFNGGKITAGTNLPILLTVTTAEIQSGGATIDTGTNNVGIQQILAGSGGLTKGGSGSLTLSGANTYSGSTLVQNGNLVVVRTNLRANISSNTIAVTFSNTNSGTFPVLSGSLGGAYTGTVASEGLNTNQTATFDTTTGTVTVATATNPAPAGPTFDGAYPDSTPLGINPQNGLTYLMSYALGGNSSNAPTLPSQDIAETTKLSLVAIVRTNDTNVTVEGEAVGNLADYSNPASITSVQGTTSGVSQSNLPTGCERRKYSVDRGTNSRQFLRLKATQK